MSTPLTTMTRQYFGTDGVRGPYGGPVINEEFARRLGRAAGIWRGKLGGGSRVVFVGRDTRFSGASLEAAVIAGLTEAGLQPVSFGVIPTPAVSWAVREQKAGMGVVITASHNPSADNGIKFFGPGGLKLTDHEEGWIERFLEQGVETPKRGTETPTGFLTQTADFEYIAATAKQLPEGALRSWRIVLDTANGATCGTSPMVLRQLGAEVIRIGDAPDGRNINDGVGSEHPELLGERVRREGARVGIAHDGDGDRCVLCDELGEVLDGDEVLTILATHALAQKTLVNSTLVITVQSNLGVDAAVSAAGGKVFRTPVGDRYVSERMREKGAMLGGESSGHIICAEVGPTGDGLVAALKVLGVMLATGRPLSELRRVLKKFPQCTRALEVRAKKPFGTLTALLATMDALEAELGARGRVLVRYSGTEPKLRLLIEGPDDTTVDSGLARLEAAARTDLEVL